MFCDCWIQTVTLKKVVHYFHFFSENFFFLFLLVVLKKDEKKGINLAKKKNLEKRSSSSLDQTYSDLTPAESAHIHTWVLDIYVPSLETPLASFPHFATVILSVEIGSSTYTRYTFFLSNHNIHKSSNDLCLWASDLLIDRF